MSHESRRLIALVTGASSGLGAEFCRQLADRCEVIIAVARRGDRLQALAAELAGRAELQPVVADLAGVEGVVRATEALRQRGPVDYLVNNAGMSTFGRFGDLSIDSQQHMVRLHIDAALGLCRAAIPFMRERGGGYIINVSSIGAFLPLRNVAVYGATKAFLNHFSLALQDELAGTGIRVQALCPGYVRTEIHEAMTHEGFDRSRIPDAQWMEAGPVVAASLGALDRDGVVVVPGADNLALARQSLGRQSGALQ